MKENAVENPATSSSKVTKFFAFPIDKHFIGLSTSVYTLSADLDASMSDSSDIRCFGVDFSMIHYLQ